MKFYIYTLGCKVNTYESNVMRENLIKNGFIESDEKNADIYIINTCTVTNTSDNKSLKIIRRILNHYSEKICVVVGCMTQVHPEVLKNLNVSIILGNSEKSNISYYINKYISEKNNIIKIDSLDNKEFENMCLKNFNQTRAYVKIEDGCDNYCSYCIIPYARGSVRSKKPENVINEIKLLVKSNYKEIVLTGIHTGHYGSDLKDCNFSKLLKEIEKINGLINLRISSIEVTELDEEFLEILSKSKIIVNHLHIPLQSGSNEILKLMNRKYDKEYFIDKIEKIRKIRPNISITTDIIVGFPGETEELFNETIATVNKIKFSKIHVFPFSLRNGTKAELIPNHISEIEKKKRVNKLLNLSKELEISYFKKFINKEVLFLPEVYKEGYLIGHTSNYLLIKAKGDKKLLNNFVEINIINIEYPYVLGKICQIVKKNLKKSIDFMNIYDII